MSGAEGKRQRDRNAAAEGARQKDDKRLKEKVQTAEQAIEAEMKALEKSKDADLLLSQLTPAHEALLAECLLSEQTAAASAQPYVPCEEGLAAVANKQRERDLLHMSVSDMKKSCQTVVEAYAHSQSMLFEATRERATAQTEVDEEKTRLQGLLRANDDDVAIVASAARLPQKIAHRDTTGQNIPELTQKDTLAAANASTQRMLVQKADLMCHHLEQELAALKQTMDAAEEQCTGPLRRLAMSNTTTIEESQQALDQAINYQRQFEETHTKLFDNLGTSVLKHMLRVIYLSEPSGNERSDLRHDILKVRRHAA